MKTFSYNKANLVNNSEETVKANIESLNRLAWRTWFWRYDKVYGCDGYAKREFNEKTKTWKYMRNLNAKACEAGEICSWNADVEVKYCESNDMYFINFKFGGAQVNEDGSISPIKFKDSDCMVIGGTYDEIDNLVINGAIMDFEKCNNI